VIGAGSFGTALAVLLARAGLRTTLQARTAEQASRLGLVHDSELDSPEQLVGGCQAQLDGRFKITHDRKYGVKAP